MVEDPAEVGQAAHELLVVHQLHQVIWGGLRLLLRFHFPDHIPGSAAHSARRRRRRRRGGRGGGEPRPRAARDPASRSAPAPALAPAPSPGAAGTARSPAPRRHFPPGPDALPAAAAALGRPARRVPHEAGGRAGGGSRLAECGRRARAAGAGRGGAGAAARSAGRARSAPPPPVPRARGSLWAGPRRGASAAAAAAAL